MGEETDLSNQALLRKLDIQGIGALLLTVFASGGAWYVLADDVEETKRSLREFKQYVDARYKATDTALHAIEIRLDSINGNQARVSEQIKSIQTSQGRIEQNQEYIRKKLEDMK